jgi:hypothetical protein
MGKVVDAEGRVKGEGNIGKMERFLEILQERDSYLSLSLYIYMSYLEDF